jgi:phage repressor protein C with HTH and peptisase S24 domain
MDFSTPHGRLRYARKDKKMSISRAAERTRINANTIKGHEAGRNGFDENQAKAYARAYGFSWLWLLHNLGDQRKVSTADVAKVTEHPPMDAIDPPSTGLVPIREVDVYAGAGGGGEMPAAYEQLKDGSWIPSESVRAEAMFPAAWLTSMGLDPVHTDIVRIRGDSMWPEIDDGDWVLVDRRVHRLEADDIYLIWDGWGVVAKSLAIVRSSRRDEPRVRIISANSKYPPEELPADDVQIIGRVHYRIGRILRAP